MLTRAGLIGDIHCEVARLQRVLEHFASAQVDSILAVGDIADGPGDLGETCRLLKSATALVVAGNHDRWLLSGEMRDLPDATRMEAVTPSTRDYLSELPKTRTLQSLRGSVLLCHGLGEDDMACVKPDDEGRALETNTALWEVIKSRKARFVVNGHSHRPMVRTISGVTILNAGTLHPKHRPVCSIADFDAGHLEIYDVDPRGVTRAERWTFELGSRPHQ